MFIYNIVFSISFLFFLGRFLVGSVFFFSFSSFFFINYSQPSCFAWHHVYLGTIAQVEKCEREESSSAYVRGTACTLFVSKRILHYNYSLYSYNVFLIKGEPKKKKYIYIFGRWGLNDYGSCIMFGLNSRTKLHKKSAQTNSSYGERLLKLDQDKALCHRLMPSLPLRLQAVINQNGRQIQKEYY